MNAQLRFEGVIPALTLPFHDDLTIDRSALGGLVASMVAESGITGVAVNAIAGEPYALSDDEQAEVIRETVAAAGGSVMVMAGISGETPGRAIELATSAQRAGADALLVQAPALFSRGIGEAPEVALGYFRELGSLGIPLVIFQHQYQTGKNYPLPLLLRILELPSVVGLKETIWDVRRYEDEVTAVRRERPGVAVLCANDTLVLPSLVAAMADGLLLGFATLVPRQMSQLFAAVASGDLASARSIHQQLAPICEVIYASPSLSYYPRLKTALVLQGRVPNDLVRAPMVATGAEDRETIKSALEASGLLGDGDARQRAIDQGALARR